MRTGLRPLRTAPVALGATLLLAACSAGAGGDEPSAEPTAAEEEPSEPAAEPSEEEVAQGADCLEGTWEADLEAATAAMEQLPGFAEAITSLEYTGASTVTFDGTTMTTEYDQQEMVLTMDLEGTPMETRASYDGTLTSTYTATDTELTVADVDLSGVTVENTTTVDGEVVDTPGLEDAEAMGIPLGGVSTYTCDAEELRITPQLEGGDGTEAEAFTQVLHRR